ncbi:MAG: phosphotransferase [Roseiflexaceae bacterium]
MSSTERSVDRSFLSIAMADIQRFGALPSWLALAAQPTFVSSKLMLSIPEFAAGTICLDACKIGGLRVNGTTHTWVGTYTLTVTTPATGQRAVLPLQGTLFPPGQPAPNRAHMNTPFGSAGWRWYLPEIRLELAIPPPEPDLPIRPQLTDPDLARTLLEHAMRQGEPAYRDVRIHACSPEVLRYHPGLRATVRYQLIYPADQPAAQNWPAVIIAKTYDGDTGQHAYDGMRALWHTPLAASADVTIAEPIAYLPEFKLLIQGPVPEDQLLKTLIESAIRDPAPTILAELDATLHKTAASLAGLHRMPTPTGAMYSWADELAEVRRFADNLAAAVPELAGVAMSLLALLDAHATATPPDSNVFAHGTFRPNQVLLHQGQVGLIDFDSWCQAEPALDLALFLASVKDVGLSIISKSAQKDTTPRLGSLARLDAICDAFLADYAALLPVSRPRVALWEALAIFTLVLRSWDRVKPVRLENTLFLLDQHMQRHFA